MKNLNLSFLTPLFFLLITFTAKAQQDICKSGNCKNGIGVMQYESNDVYSGNFLNGMRNGKGVYTSVSGSVFDCEWVNDLQQGNGIYTNANNDKYIGQFFQGNKEGKGIYTFGNGNIYDGNWKNDDYYVSEVVNGNRAIGREQAKSLGKFFKLLPGLFPLLISSYLKTMR